MLHFQPVTIDNKEAIEYFFSKSTFRNCDFSFSNIFAWQHFYNTTFAIENDCLYIRFHKEGETPGYLFPLGEAQVEDSIKRITDDARKRGDGFHLYSITQKMFDLIEEALPGTFVYEQDRAWFEYIYRSEDLISLVGKKFQQKRNHINKFKRTYSDWRYLPITRDIIPDCLELYELWCRENGNCNSEESLIEERIATQRAFANYEQLGLIGGALYIDGKIRAYSYGQPLTKDTFGVHAEKSLTSIDGGFTMMNQQFAEHNCKDFLYINREEDLGLESLRKAKLSYQPAFLLEKGSITIKE